MDRDVALKLLTNLTAVKTAVQTLATNTTPTAADNRSASPAPAENQRSLPEADPEAPEAPEEPETRTKK